MSRKEERTLFSASLAPYIVLIKQSETFYHQSKPKFQVLCFHRNCDKD